MCTSGIIHAPRLERNSRAKSLREMFRSSIWITGGILHWKRDAGYVSVVFPIRRTVWI